MLIWLLLSVGLAVYLSANPTLREFVDEVLLGKPRATPVAPTVTAKRKEAIVQAETNTKTESALLECPDAVKEPLDKLLQLVIRDFVSGWYNSYISLGDERFPAHARTQLNILVNNLTHRITAQDTKEVAVYLVHSLSTSLVYEMQTKDSIVEYDEKVIIGKLRQTSQELLHLVAPPQLLASSATLTLLTEILTLQLWKIIQSINSDWINQRIVSSLSEIETDRALLSITEPAPSRPVTPSSTETNNADKRTRKRPDFMAEIKHDLAICTDGATAERNSLLLRLLMRLDSAPSRKDKEESDPVGAQLLTDVLSRSDEELADAFQSFIDDLPPIGHARAQLLSRLHGQIASYAKVIEMTLPDAATLRQDSLAMLSRMVDALENESSTSLQTVLIECLVEMIGPKPKVTALGNLQEWLFDELHNDYFQAFLKESADPKTPMPPQTAFSPPLPGVLANFTSPTFASPVVKSPSIRTLSPRSSIDSMSDDDFPFELPKVTVNVTDTSANEAYDSIGKCKSRRHLAFLIALEVQGGSPGYILQRSFAEIEKMASKLDKAERPAIPQVEGMTSDALCTELETYLGGLLSDSRLSQTPSVRSFFEKERAGASQPGLSLWDLGREASKATKRTANLAQKGLSTATKSINSVGSALLKPTDTLSRKQSAMSVASVASVQSFSALGTDPMTISPTNSSFDLALEESAKQEDGDTAAKDSTVDVVSSVMAPASAVADVQQVQGSVEKPSIPPPTVSFPESSDLQSQLTAHDFDLVLNCGLSVLEEAYLLANQQWSLKRGILSIISTVVRTSYAASIKVAFLQAINTADAETAARKIEDLCESLWPDGKWYSTDAQPIPPRTDAEQEETRLAAKKLLVAQAPEGLKLALGSGATTDAVARFHDTLQGNSSTRLVSVWHVFQSHTTTHEQHHLLSQTLFASPLVTTLLYGSTNDALPWRECEYQGAYEQQQRTRTMQLPNTMQMQSGSLPPRPPHQPAPGPSTETLTAADRRSRSSKACDQCKKAKCKCAVDKDASGEAVPPCENCRQLNRECTFNSQAKKRGPPKGYLDAVENRLHRMETLLAGLVESPDPRAQELLAELMGDEEARSLFSQDVKLAVSGKSRRSWENKPTNGNAEDLFAGVDQLEDSTTSGKSQPSNKNGKRRRLSLGMTDSAMIQSPFSGSPLVDPQLTAINHTGFASGSDLANPNPTSELADVVGQLSVSPGAEIRYHGRSSGLYLISSSQKYRNFFWQFGKPPTMVEPLSPPDMTSSADQAIYESAIGQLPNLETQKRLLDVYWTYIHPHFPILHRTWFTAQYTKSVNGKMRALSGYPAQIPAFLLFSMFALAARYIPDSHLPSEGAHWPAGDNYLKQAQAIMATSDFVTSRLSSVQGLLLLGYREMGCGATARAWFHIGNAVRMAQDLGLFRDVDRWFMPIATFSHEEKQSRKRTWYGCLQMDKYVSTYIGRPAAIFERDWDCACPNEDEPDEHERWKPLSADGRSLEEDKIARPKSHAVSTFNKMSDLAVHTGRIISNLYAIRVRVLGQSSEVLLSHMDQGLANFYLKLPEELQYTANSKTVPPPHILALHCQFYCSLILLHRPFIPLRGKTTPAYTSQPLPSHTIATTSANAITNIAMAYSKSYGLSRAIPFMVYYIFSAAIMHVYNTTWPGEAKAARLNLAKCMRALKEMEGAWTGAYRQRELLLGLVDLGDAEKELEAEDDAKRPKLMNPGQQPNILSHLPPPQLPFNFDPQFFNQMPGPGHQPQLPYGNVPNVEGWSSNGSSPHSGVIGSNNQRHDFDTPMWPSSSFQGEISNDEKNTIYSNLLSSLLAPSASTSMAGFNYYNQPNFAPMGMNIPAFGNINGSNGTDSRRTSSDFQAMDPSLQFWPQTGALNDGIGILSHAAIAQQPPPR